MQVTYIKTHTGKEIQEGSEIWTVQARLRLTKTMLCRQYPRTALYTPQEALMLTQGEVKM